MLIEEGKFYRTREWSKIGPMRRTVSSTFPWVGALNGGSEYAWGNDGKWYADGRASPMDLVAEWTDPPALPDPVALIREMREALIAARPALLTAQEHLSLQARIEVVEAAIAKADAYLEATP